jgi:hypothetical protein
MTDQERAMMFEMTTEEKIMMLEDRYERHTTESHRAFRKWEDACRTICRVLQREGGVTDSMADQIERYQANANDALADALAEARMASNIWNALGAFEHSTKNN